MRATCYSSSPIIYTQLTLFGDEETVSFLDSGNRAYKIEVTEVLDYNGDGAVDLADVETLLKNKEKVNLMI